MMTSATGTSNSLISIGPTTARQLLARHGFTLIEILVAIVIISVVLGIALIKFDVNNFETKIKQEAGRLARSMELADQTAIFESREIGLLMEDNNYQFFSYEEKQWKPLDDPLLKKRSMPEQMEIILSVDGTSTNLKTAANADKVPQIVFFSSGEWTPFEIIMTEQDNNEVSYVLSNIKTGKLELNREARSLQ